MVESYYNFFHFIEVINYKKNKKNISDIVKGQAIDRQIISEPLYLRFLNNNNTVL